MKLISNFQNDDNIVISIDNMNFSRKDIVLHIVNKCIGNHVDHNCHQIDLYNLENEKIDQLIHMKINIYVLHATLIIIAIELLKAFDN